MLYTKHNFIIKYVMLYTQKLKIERGISLGIQWLKLHDSTAGGTASVPGWRIRSHLPHGEAREKKKRKKKWKES